MEGWGHDIVRVVAVGVGVGVGGGGLRLSRCRGKRRWMARN